MKKNCGLPQSVAKKSFTLPVDCEFCETFSEKSDNFIDLQTKELFPSNNCVLKKALILSNDCTKNPQIFSRDIQENKNHEIRQSVANLLSLSLNS